MSKIDFSNNKFKNKKFYCKNNSKISFILISSTAWLSKETQVCSTNY